MTNAEQKENQRGVSFPLPRGSAGVQPTLSADEFPGIILCKYTITGSLHPEQFTA